MSAQESNELTLEGIAQRLEALERENAQLRQKVVTLEGSGTRSDEVAALRSSETSQAVEPASAFEGRVSRRSLLSKAGAAAVAAMAAGMILNLREAKAGTDIFDTIWCGDLLADTGGVRTTHTSGGRAVDAFNKAEQTATVYAYNDGGGPAVRGLGGTGVWGSSYRDGYAGVYGSSNVGAYGVVGDGEGASYAGVLGRNKSGTGVRGESSTVGHAAVVGKHSNAGFQAIGVRGDTVDGVGVLGVGKLGVHGKSATPGHAAVYGEHIDTEGPGVVGDGRGWDAGVLGRSPASSGVQGEGLIGLQGKASVSYGYGGLFEGGKAQLKLEPGSSVGLPTNHTHYLGEIYLDARGTLFVCTGDGNPGTWRRITTTPVS